MPKKPIICFLISVLFLLVGLNKSLAYAPDTTHAALTQEIIEFYNLLFPDKKISAEEAEWIIQGSVDEDKDIRAINHFYDPVRKIGWTGEGVGQFSASEVKSLTSALVAPDGVDAVPATEWVNDRDLQARHYSRYGGDKTWTQAIEYLYAGKTEEAYYTLGYVLHLLEDMAVPEHTRNDLHPPGEDSPYEAYADEKWNRSSINSLDIPNKLVREGAVLPSISSIEDYLRSMASYSNRYFFSKDSINDSHYELGISEKDCDSELCFGKDDKGVVIPLAKKKEITNPDKSFKVEFSLERRDSFIFEAYFTRLAPEAVLHGAAVINLFYNEAQDYIPTRIVRGKGIGSFSLIGELSKAWNSTKSFFANIGDGIVGLFSQEPDIQVIEILDESIEESGEGLGSAEETVSDNLVLENKQDDEFDRLSEAVEGSLPKEVVQDVVQEDDEELPVVATSTVSVATSTPQTTPASVEVKSCSFGDESLRPVNPIGPIIINEVAWMGTIGSASDEWIELKNISNTQVDIADFQIWDKGEQVKIIFETGEKIPPGGFYLLERTDDDSVPSISADRIYVGALGNSDESLRLYNAECNLIDEVIANPDWPAGSNSSKGTMERKVDLTWQSSATQGGTPKAQNSVPTQSAGGGGGSSAITTTEQTETEASTEIATSSTSTANIADHILISEIKVSGADAGDEFVELYNPTGGLVDISDWSIQYVSGSAEVSTSTVSKKNFLATSTITADQFYLIGRNTDEGGADGYVGSVVADMGHRSFSISGAVTGGKIFLVSNQEEIESVNDPDIVDFVDYSFSVPDDGQGLERRYLNEGICGAAQNTGEFLGNGCDTDSDSDFDIRAASKPQSSASLPEPRDAPIAVSDFSVSYHFSVPTLTLNWDDSQDYTGATGTVSYQISEINTPTNSTSFIFNATSTALEQVIDEIGRNYEFSIKAVDVDGLASVSMVASTTVPSFVDDLYFYRDTRASSTEYLIDLYYANYPFVSDPYWSTPNDDWKIVVFYHNTEAVKGGDLITVSSWNPADLTDVLTVRYRECSAGNLTTNYRMIIPDNSGRCGVGGGLNNSSRVWDDFEDNHLQVRVASSTEEIIFDSDSDYLTAAFYSLSGSGGGNQALKLVAVDRTKYYFQNSSPDYNQPSVPGNFSVVEYTVNSPTSTVEISWHSSTDADTLDNLINYEWSLDNINFQPLTLTSAGEPKSANLSLALGSTSTIQIRAVDDFSVVSAPATTTLVLPEAIIDTTADPSNPYFAVDEARVEGNILKIKWRLISAPDTTKAFGIIPYLSASGTPASLDNYRALHRDYGGVIGYPFVTGQESGQCNAAITPLSDYTFGWQYETRFSTVGGRAVSADLIGQTLEFALYTRNPAAEPICNLGDAVSSPFFTGLPVVVE